MAPRAAELDRIFRLENERTISEDCVVRYDNRFFQLQPQSRHYTPAQGKVLVCEGRDGAWPSSTAGAHCAGRRFLRPPGRVLLLRVAPGNRALRFRPQNESGCRQRIIRGEKPRAEQWRNKRGARPAELRSPSHRRWPCPALRPKRSALRATQGFAPGKANDQQKTQNQKRKRGHF